MVTIGVSGHREFSNLATISSAVDEVLEKIRVIYPEESIRVISPLAEGADRLVAMRAIEKLSAQLFVPLPFKMSVYMLDFKTDSSKAEFMNLIQLATEIIQLPDQGSRGKGFLAVGKYVLNLSDVLIAIWDGAPARGTGGTGQIVAEARKQGKPLAWIQVESRSEDVLLKGDKFPVQYERFPNLNSFEDDKR